MFIRFHVTAIPDYWLHFLLLLTIIVVLPLGTLAQNISINDSLTASPSSSSWRSPNGDFAFGFRQTEGDANLFVLSIWYDKIPDKTIVWYERSSYPVQRGSILQLQARGGLILRDPQGFPLYNTPPATTNEVVTRGYMQDNGNFVLTGANSSNILWESFRHPADTILPSQTIEINETLISPKTQTDLAEGRFRARMDTTGNFSFSFKNEPRSEDFGVEYYSSQTSSSNANASNSGYRVKFDETVTGFIFVETRDGQRLTNLSSQLSQNSQNYYRATLDYDGVFTLYYHPKILEEGGAGWTPQRRLPSDPSDICGITVSRGSSVCGYNNMCIVQNGRPVCECPQGFSLADPNNTHSDCKSDFVQNCIQTEQEECSLMEIPDVNWPMYDYELIRGSSEQGCKDACLKDSFCSAAVIAHSGCWKKTLPLSNGRNEAGAKTLLKRGKALNQTQNHGPPQPKAKGDNKLLILVGSVILGSSVLVNLFFTTAACFGFFPKIKFPATVRNPAADTAPGSNLRCFTYKQLLQATDGFKEELGRGAFGIVYKGTILNHSRTTVAVKKLQGVAQDSEKEFRAEVDIIGQVHHRNVVRLLGFCDEGPNRLLVYEHMANGNLAGYLFGNVKPGWSQRTQIALGVARGLAYLHEECNTQIIHCDIKPQNILLDHNYTARISDFGLAKLLMLNQSRTVTNIRGTKGYVSPEWFRNTQITAKVDVYSFGVVLLEIVSCRKTVLDATFGDVDNPILTEWAWECFLEGRLDTLVNYDDEALRDGEMLERFVKVGLWCTQEDAALRPTMRTTCQMLEATVDVEVPPCASSFAYVSTQL